MNGLDGQRVRVAVIGAGFAGLGTALRLHAAGETSFVVIERGDTVGGTWRDNRYPGVACDIPSHLYCFSFLPNPWFSRRFADGAELHRYLDDAAAPVREHLSLGTTMTATTWLEHEAAWRVETDRGTVLADVVVMACGRLSEPRHPDVPIDFDGPVMHSARWDDSVSLAGRRVGVVGTGASAVQLLPHVAREAASVTVLQRSAPYVMPRDDTPFSLDERARWAADPVALAEHRAQLADDAELGHAARISDGPARTALTARALGHLAHQVVDPVLRSALTPDHELGCKRPVFSDDYYPTLTLDHVELVTSPLVGVTSDAMLTADGGRHEVDVVVLATGFESTRQPYADLVTGRHGSLSDRWSTGMRAYASTAVSGFPNLFVVNGPNASLGHSSSVLMIEAQVGYVVDALGSIPRGTALDVHPDLEDAYVAEMDRRSADAVWQSGCSSWYLDPGSGRQVLLWPGRSDEFAERMATFDPTPFRTTRVPAPTGWTVVVPLKPARLGKSRLQVPHVDHAALASALALDTIRAAAAATEVDAVVVVTSDPDWVGPAGVRVVHEHAPTGISDAVARGVAAARPDGPVAVLLGDLPGLRPDELDDALTRAARHDRAAVADREGTGTTLATFGAGTDVEVHFGPGSWAAHVAAGHSRLPVAADSGLRRDVDVAEHLGDHVGPATAAVLTGSRVPVLAR